MSVAESAQETSFAQMCYQHVYAGCGCGMCKEGDVCPTPIIKLEEKDFDENEVPERNAQLLDRSLIETSQKE